MGRQIGIVLLGVVLLSAENARAFTVAKTPTGLWMRWIHPHINLAGNPDNISGLSHSEVRSAVVRGLQRWKYGSESLTLFDYWQGSNKTDYVANTTFDGRSSFYFASNDSTGAPPVASHVLGLTQTWFDTSSGEILETDIVLNDLNYKFSTDPSDTSGSGAGVGSTGRVYVENVITHELGHAYGLSHAANLQSTMLFVEAPDQAHLSCDEQAGIKFVYGGAHYGGRGIIRGRVTTSGGAGIFGANVAAISKSTGTVEATVLTEGSGEYFLSNLQPGDYFVYVEPFVAGGSVLPDYYNAINTKVCGNQHFSRTFHRNQSGDLMSVNVEAYEQSSTGTIEVSCNGISGASTGLQDLNAGQSFGSPIELPWGESGGARVGRMQFSGDTKYYELSDYQGDLRAVALAYSLYSPIRVQLRLYNSAGQLVEAGSVPYQSESGFVNYDSALEVHGLPLDDYTLQISSQALSGSYYPGHGQSIDPAPFFVITATDELAENPGNAKCRQDEDFPSYHSPNGPPPVASNGTNDDEGGSGLFGCGTIQSGNGGGPTGPQILAALLNWALMFGGYAWFRLRTRRRVPNIISI